MLECVVQLILVSLTVICKMKQENGLGYSLLPLTNSGAFRVDRSVMVPFQLDKTFAR